MKILSVENQLTSRNIKYYGFDNKKTNSDVNFQRGLPSQKQYYRELAKEELVNYIRYNFSKGAVKKLNINNNLDRNNMLLLFAKKLFSEINESKTEIQNENKFFENISHTINPKNKAQKLILSDRYFSTNDFLTLANSLNNKENIKLTENLLGLRDVNGVAIDFSKTLNNIFNMHESSKLNKYFYKYKSYIILNANNEKFLENLKNELDQNGNNIPYNKLDRIVYIQKKQLVFPILNKIPKEVLMNGNYEALDFLTQGYTSQVINQFKEIPDDGLKFFEYFIATSTNDNIATRMKFLSNNLSHSRKNQAFSDIQLLFEKIDADENFKKIVDKYLDSALLSGNINVKELLFYVDKFGSKVLAENSDNFINIMRLSRRNTPDEKVEIIEKNLKNKYYITPYEIEAQKYEERFQSKRARIKGNLRRSMNKFFERISGPFPKVSKLNDVKFEDYMANNKVKNENVKEIIENVVKPNPENVVKNINTEEIKVQVVQNIAQQSVIEVITAQPVIETKTPVTKKKIVREYKSTAPQISAKKLKIFEESQAIVKSRMKSAAQIEEQARDYSLTATKKRNKYLNEIFDYVSDVRKAENKAKIKKHSVSNYDVLELYQKINVYNEKEFRKMLRAKNEQGERLFSFEEINEMLDNSIIEHHRILREKQSARRKSRAEISATA